MDQSIRRQESVVINSTAQGSVTTRLISQRRSLVSGRLQSSLKRKTVRKRLVRTGLIGANVVVLAVVTAFVVGGSRTNSLSATGSLSDNAAANPVDGLTAYDIAANVARMTELPESTAIVNQAQSAQVSLAVSASATSVVAKPQIVATALKSRYDIQTYTAQADDTASSVAQKFGITTNSVEWSNNLTGNAVSLGVKLVIPPINGIVYTVKAGDTPDTLAAKFSANAAQIVAYNDAEIAGLTPGEQILIPNGQIQQVASSSAQPANLFGSFTPLFSTASSGGNCARWVSRYPCLYGNNGYDYGWCTWYVASRIAMPSNWGNASTWAYFAALSGWSVSTTPTPGAIAQTTSGDHVAYVEQVSADGSQIIYSDMNGLAGWGNVGISGWVPATHFEHYITH